MTVPAEETETRDIETPPVVANDDKKDDDTVYDKITFTPTGDINRSLPILLADSGKMSVMIWDKFCDSIDDCTKPVGRIQCVSKTLWFLIAVLFVLNIFGWKITGQNADGTEKSGIAAYYGLIVPVMIILVILTCNIESCINNKVSSKMSNACASTSNRDRDLTLTLKGTDPDSWYIEVALRNAAANVNASEVAAGVPIAVATPVAAGGPPPKKYVKMYGKLMLNPEYTVWKNTQ
mmetsp:Transcript_9933/g.24766  ORF Transcript_9933/g.24766 Transcript_9933/m.24766 type:complete len:235 (-) Transcript_9933:2540-3244(-)